MTHREPDEVLKNLLELSSGKIDVNDLALCILREFDGNAGLADALKKCFDKNPDGSQNQVRILSDIIRLMNACTGAEGDDADIDEEDARAIVREILESGIHGDQS